MIVNECDEPIAERHYPFAAFLQTFKLGGLCNNLLQPLNFVVCNIVFVKELEVLAEVLCEQELLAVLPRLRAVKQHAQCVEDRLECGGWNTIAHQLEDIACGHGGEYFQ